MSLELNALYQIHRQQTLIAAITTTDPIYPDGYLYAVYRGVAPVFHDSWCIGEDPFEDVYPVRRAFVEKVLKYLDDIDLAKAPVPDFYAIEKTFGGREFRADLIAVIRYAFLDDRFSKDFYDAILAPTMHPSEAAGITSPFSKSDIYLV